MPVVTQLACKAGMDPQFLQEFKEQYLDPVNQEFVQQWVQLNAIHEQLQHFIYQEAKNHRLLLYW